MTKKEKKLAAIEQGVAESPSTDKPAELAAIEQGVADLHVRAHALLSGEHFKGNGRARKLFYELGKLVKAQKVGRIAAFNQSAEAEQEQDQEA